MAERTETDVEKVKRLTRWQRLGLATLFLAGVLIVGTGVFVWSGLYNISARTDHWRATDWLIVQLRDRSIATRASGIEVPDLSAPGLARLGVEHYRAGCAGCHGLPGEDRNPIQAAMLPEPPDLTHAGEKYSAAELFWIVYHGLKYTGMPAWPGEDREDEVWPLVALLQHLGREGSESFASLAAPENMQICTRCHGGVDRVPVSGLVPWLHGQPQPYLARAMREYRSGERESGMMEAQAHDMADTQIESMAGLFAGMPPPRNDEREETTGGALARGELLVSEGMREEGVPSCGSCHGGSNPQYPRLAGQSERYLYNQLQLFAEGGRSQSGYGAIMTAIAERLTDEDMQAAAAYYAAQPLSGGGEAGE